MRNSGQKRQTEAMTVNVREAVREMIARRARLFQEAQIIPIKKKAKREALAGRPPEREFLEER